MKQKVTLVRDLGLVLRDMESWIRNPDILYSGRSGNMKLLPREILGNWLLCAAGNATDPAQPFTFCNDPVGGGDGIIINTKTDEQMVTEHVFVPQHQKKDGVNGDSLIVDAVFNKQNKGGEAYAHGKHLIVFCDGIGEWLPNKVGREIAGKHDFASVWTAGLLKPEADRYAYWVAHLNEKHSPVVEITINFQNYDWSVTSIQ